jgi:hypothetical protein
MLVKTRLELMHGGSSGGFMTRTNCSADQRHCPIQGTKDSGHLAMSGFCSQTGNVMMGKQVCCRLADCRLAETLVVVVGMTIVGRRVDSNFGFWRDFKNCVLIERIGLIKLNAIQKMQPNFTIFSLTNKTLEYEIHTSSSRPQRPLNSHEIKRKVYC